MVHSRCEYFFGLLLAQTSFSGPEKSDEEVVTTSTAKSVPPSTPKPAPSSAAKTTPPATAKTTPPATAETTTPATAETTPSSGDGGAAVAGSADGDTGGSNFLLYFITCAVLVIGAYVLYTNRQKVRLSQTKVCLGATV